MVDASPPSILAVRPLPAGRLALGRRRQGRGAVVSAVVHGAIIVVLFWKGAQLMRPGGGGAGPRGGGGGGAEAAHFFLLAGAAPRPAMVLPPAPVVVAPHIPLPDPAQVEVPKIETPPPPAAAITSTASTAANSGTNGGPGEGSGTLGGKGTGAGTGAGSDLGPGTGGPEGYSFPPQIVGLVFPPLCAPKGSYTVRFWVTVGGQVSRVEIDPLVKNGDCRHDFESRMLDYKFTPAKTRDGVPTAGVAMIQTSK